MSTESKISSTETVAKLRRLKIQESVLFSSLLTLLTPMEVDVSPNIYIYCERKKMDSPLKVLFIQIRNLLEDIKIEVNSEKNSKYIDVCQLKKEVLDLETKLKCFKTQLQEQLIALKDDAIKIEEQLRTNEFNDKRVRNKTEKQQIRQFAEITPSPVRALINSPSKCVEVQELQEFLAHSHKGNGKWNEYNHNIFVKIWNKYFSNTNDGEPQTYDDIIKRKDVFNLFSEEIMKNVPGITYDDMTTHLRWHCEYLFLKYSQQKALERWRENKQKIKKPLKQLKQDLQPKPSDFKYKTLKEKSLHRFEKGTVDIKSKVFKSTEQWRNRCESINNPTALFACKQHKSQVRIPDWRLVLSKNDVDI